MQIGPLFHNPVAACWLPIVGPNPPIVDLNAALACAGPFMDALEGARVGEILGVLNQELSPEERSVLQQWLSGLNPATYGFSPADASSRIRFVVEGPLVQNPMTGRHFTAAMKKDLLAIANRIEGRFHIPFLASEV